MGRRRFTEPEPSGPSSSLHSGIVIDSLDLHGLSADTAEQKVSWFLERMVRQHPGEVIRIVTGKGNRSEADPVLRPLISKLLGGECARFVEEWTSDVGGGAFLVRLK